MTSVPRPLCWVVLTACVLAPLGCASSSTTKGEEGPKVSKANFEKVKDGMTPEDVEKILGPAKHTQEVDANKAKEMVKGVKMPELPPDLPGVQLPKFTVKQWEEGDTVYEVVFQDGKVVGKDSGSKKTSEGKQPEKRVTKENDAKIKTGMTKAEVEAILGPGTVDNSAKIEGFSGGVTVWKDGDNVIQIGFKDDKVVAKTSHFK
jgi:outer membrane protein assembly factor BamE (lipoprotein component of BamABCDE complex)